MLYIGIPAHNEATTIGVLLWRLRSVLSDVSREYEVVVYDDASTDETAATLAPYSRVLPLTVLRGDKRLGYAGAVNAIARHVARTTRYPRRDALLLLQGDFTDPPALVPEFLRRFEGGADLVIGERTSAGDAPVAVQRLWKAARWVLRPFVGITDVRDLTSSFRLVRIAVLRDLIKANGDAPIMVGEGWSANADFLLRTAPLARRVETIPVTPTFSVRTRETRRTAWPDAVALARWGWRRRGDRVTVRVIARTVETQETPDELVAPDPTERPAAPERRERSERSERSERAERRPRRERGDRGEREPRERADGGERRPDGAPESATDTARGERKPRTRGRARRGEATIEGARREDALADSTADIEETLAPATADGSPDAVVSSPDGAAPERRSRRKRSRTRSRGERTGESAREGEAADDDAPGSPQLGPAEQAAGSPDADSDPGAAPRRKRSRRGRRKRTDGAEGSAEGRDEGSPEGATEVSSSGRSDGYAGGDASGSENEGEATGADDAPRRRRSRRGRRGGSRRRTEGADDSGGTAGADGPRDGDASGPQSDD